MKNANGERTETYGGLFGAMAPLLSFFLAIIVFSVCGIRGTKSYWSAGITAMVISFFLYKNKDHFQKAVVEGIRDEVFVMSLLALYFAGILSKTLTAGHLVNGLMWIASEINLSPAIMPLATFLITAAIATASGTSAGSVATVTPVMLPLCTSMGCSPELTCGAIVSGAYFGDNLAPVSDTTIASAMTQEVSLGKVVKSRLKYSITGAVFASIMFFVFGHSTVDIDAVVSIEADASFATSVAYVILPILVVTLMIRGKNLLTSLLVTDLLGMIMLLVLGDATPTAILSASGIIVNGIEGMQGATILMMFAFVVNSLTRATGFMDHMIDFVQSHAKTPRSSESGVAAFICCLMMATGGNTASIAVTGPMARRLMRPFHVARERTANILDGMASGVGCFVPHSPANATMTSLALSLGVVANESFSAFDYARYNFHGMALIAIFWIVILTGWGRRVETVEELKADGIEVEESLSA